MNAFVTASPKSLVVLPSKVASRPSKRIDFTLSSHRIRSNY